MYDVNDPFMIPTLFGLGLLIVLAVLVWMHRDRSERVGRKARLRLGWVGEELRPL